MEKFPALSSMGVQNPEQIARFTVSSTQDMDVLRIIYDRKKGSILPVSKKYRFPQLKKSTMVDSGTRRAQVVYESSLEFRNAMSELNKLMDAREGVHDIRELISEEVRLLEEEMAVRIEYIKSLVKKI